MEHPISPEKKRMKVTKPENPSKLENECNEHPKRAKVEKDIQTKKKQNFVAACEQVSCQAYYDYRTRLGMIYLPTCVDRKACKHQTPKDKKAVKQMSSYAEELVKIEMKANMWCEALEVCFLCITTDQYLSASVLKDVVEIMLNAHEDTNEDYTIPFLIEKCQQVLSQNFSSYPPCKIKSLRKCYNDFLTSPMDSKEETFSNRSEFGYTKGIVKYCMNKLQYELSIESKDEPLLNKYEHLPDDMKKTVKGMHWEKEKFEIYELLERPERIRRLMAVLESIIELVQFDLAIWLSRHSHNQGLRLMMSVDRPLIAIILWPENRLYTGTVSSNCRQILSLFVYLVHLNYPEEHVKVMSSWLMVIIQILYSCETNSHIDYPNTGIYIASFAKEFYNIISEMPQDTIIKILQTIEFPYMQYIIGTLHIQNLLKTKEDDIIKIFINFLNKSEWKMFPESTSEIEISKNPYTKWRKLNKMKYLLKLCDMDFQKKCSIENQDNVYPKHDPDTIQSDSDIDQNCIFHILYITIDSYLDAYNVQLVQETIDKLNDQLENISDSEECPVQSGVYSVTETFIKKYRTIYETLKQLLQKMKEIELPANMKIFKNIGLE